MDVNLDIIVVDNEELSKIKTEIIHQIMGVGVKPEMPTIPVIN